MTDLIPEQEKELRRKEYLEKHERLSKLFREDRLSFERERKSAIKALIDSAPDEEQRKRLWDLQDLWDKRMKGAASAHNRFVLAQTFFWEHFHEVWSPAIESFSKTLNQTRE